MLPLLPGSYAALKGFFVLRVYALMDRARKNQNGFELLACGSGFGLHIGVELKGPSSNRVSGCIC